MNLPLDQLPAQCDVLVIGAGPAGSAAAATLARQGGDVVLVDQRSFPRDKVCGDGLIPDAHAALAKLGVLDEVMACAQRVGHVGCIGPRGGRIDVPGELAVLPRRELDAILCAAAVRAGARMHAPVRFESLLHDSGGRAVGARLSHDGSTREVRAPWLVLATGAVPQALMAADMCERQAPTGIALRGYVKNHAMTTRITEMEVVWHRALRPGYGWIFPCGGGRFNIGVGVVDSRHKTARGDNAIQNVNLRHVSAITALHRSCARGRDRYISSASRAFEILKRDHSPEDYAEIAVLPEPCRGLSLSLLKRLFQRASLAFQEQFLTKLIVITSFCLLDVVVLSAPSFERARYIGILFRLYRIIGKVTGSELFIKLVDIFPRHCL